MSRLTDEIYWSEGYRKRGAIEPVSVEGDLNRCNRQLFALLEAQGLDRKDVLEIGGGGSAWLGFLAGRFPSSTFTGLDYSEAGCRLLQDHARAHGLTNLLHICADFAEPPEASIRRYDLVYSLGVAEHFADLAGTLAHFRRLLAPGATLVTVIPNMAGVIGSLTRLYNRRIYDLHVPYDRNALVAAHVEAGLAIMDSGYVCSTNFGVLSSCFDEPRGLGFATYKWLSRVSKLAWMCESRFGDLPKTPWLAPYIHVVAREPGDAGLRSSSTNGRDA